jgi:hypothetical protein
MKHILLLLTTTLLLYACATTPDPTLTPPPEPEKTFPAEFPTDPLPRFVNTNYIELDKISRISYFRSAVGLSFWDEFEFCRNMKHYFQPRDDVDWAAVKIFSPVDGQISKLDVDWGGIWVHIIPDLYPQFTFTIFHVALDPTISEGMHVAEGQQLGTHVGTMTTSDIAVGWNIIEGFKFVSFFEVMTDELFETFANRGIQSREEMIITKEERDEDPLTCEGEIFTYRGTLPNWFTLTETD